MSLLDFAADIVATGTVLGVDASSSPDQVAGILGDHFAETRRHGLMWRDWGVTEFFWQRGAGAVPWRGTHFSVQIHRLAANPDAAEVPTKARFGTFESSLPFADLRAALNSRGVELVEIPPAGAGIHEYWQPDTQVVVLVDHGAARSVVKISAPLDTQAVAVRRHRGEARPLRQALEQLVSASEPDRLRWLDRREPAESDRTNWWLHLLALIDYRVEQDPERKDWILFHLWALGQAHSRGALSATETAIRTAYFVQEQYEREGSRESILAVLPSPDEVVRACLDDLPMTFEQAARPTELSWTNIAAMRASRHAKNLITAASPHQGRLSDPRLSADLARWSDLCSRLV